MFTLGISGLIAAYVLVALLLLSINLYSNWSWPVKAGTIVITTVFYIITYLSLPPLLGWPAKNDLPEKFRLIAAQVRQPSKLTDDKGAIYLWAIQADDLSSTEPPRAYELPYSGILHEQVINAEAKLKKGVPLLGESKKPPDDAVILENITKTGQKTSNIQFYELPDPLIPDK